MAEQRVQHIPLSNRRLDSLAWILQGDNTVAAATVDENELLMAFNYCPSGKGKLELNFFKKKQSNVWNGEDIFESIKKHLMLVAKSSRDFVESLNKPENTEKLATAAAAVNTPAGPKTVLSLSLSLAKRYSAHKKECQESLERLEERIKKASTLINRNRLFREAVHRSLVKVTRSIRHAYLYPGTEKAIAENVKNAIEQGNIKLVFPQINDYPGKNLYPSREIHAEMSILNDLIARGRIKEGSNFYMGVSKKCCFTCEIAVNAVNKVFKSKFMEENADELEGEEVIESEDEDNLISIRGEHSYIFPAVPPNFLCENEGIRNEFLRLFKEKLKGFIAKEITFHAGKKEVSTEAHVDELEFYEVFLLTEDVTVEGKDQVHSLSNSKEGDSTFSSQSHGPFIKNKRKF